MNTGEESVPVAFLSHTSKDAQVAGRLAADLLKAGIEVWYAPWEIKPGDSLRRKIDAGIDAARYFMVLLTPASLRSEWVGRAKLKATGLGPGASAGRNTPQSECPASGCLDQPALEGWNDLRPIRA